MKVGWRDNKNSMTKKGNHETTLTKTRNYDNENTNVRWKRRNNILKMQYNFALYIYIFAASYFRESVMTKTRKYVDENAKNDVLNAKTRKPENMKLRWQKCEVTMMNTRNYKKFSISCFLPLPVFVTVLSCLPHRSLAFYEILLLQFRVFAFPIISFQGHYADGPNRLSLTKATVLW